MIFGKFEGFVQDRNRSGGRASYGKPAGKYNEER